MLALTKLTSIHTFKKLIKLQRNYSRKLPPTNIGCTCCECPNTCLPFSIACKVALVTGGESGIGYSIAGQLLMEGARNVVITGSNCDQGMASMTVLNQTFGHGKVMYINSDANDKTQLEGLYKTTLCNYSQLDCVVNCVGMFDGENWECEIMTNLVSAIRSNVLSYRYMALENKGCGGVVLNIAGIHGMDILPSAPTLSAAHHGLVGFTRSLGHGKNSERSGIRFVTLCPGITNTNFLKECDRKAMSDEMGYDLKKYLKKMKLQNPDVVGLAAMHLIKNAKSGTVWVCENSKLLKLSIPDRSCFSKLKKQLC